MKQLKAIVRKEFLDRYTGKINKVGAKLTITDERFREINRSGNYVEIAKETKKESK